VNNGVNNGANNGVNNGANNGVNNGVNNGANNGGPECESDEACDGEQYCELAELECRDGCRIGGCEAGFCDPDSRACVEGRCSEHEECGEGAYCNQEGACAAGCYEGSCDDNDYCELDSHTCQPGPACNGDGDCPDGTWCESDSGECLEGCREGECGQGAACDLDSRTCVCETDEACADGQYCEWDAGVCLDGCREGGCADDQVCDPDSRTCVGVPCEEDNDCAQRQYCSDGNCADGCREGGCDEGESCDADTRQCVGEPVGPQIEVRPEAIDFGEVGLNNSVIQDLTVSNVGDATLVLSEVVLEDNPSQGFNIIAPSQDPLLFVEPGESVTYRVRMQPTFLPQGQDEVRYNNAVVVRSNDVDNARVEVPLTGLATSDPEVCLAFDPRAIDFGFVEPNNVEARTVELSNCGQNDVTLTAIDLSDDIDALSVAVGGMFPRTLDPGDSLRLSLTYAPVDAAGFQTTLVAETLGDLQAISILSATGSPTNGARIEVVWDNRDDVDLHLIREVDGEFSEPGRGDEVNPNDCYHANPNPDWGVEGDPADNPFFSGDDDDFGPESTAIASFEEDGRYLVVARFARNRSFGSPDLVLRVFSGGEVATFEARLNEPGDVFAPVIIESDGALTPNQ
jgi:hypothetical protein